MAHTREQIFAELSAARFRRPFVPFAIVLTDGRRFEVNERLHVGFAEGNPRIVVLPSGGPHEFFDWDKVAAIEIHEPAA